MAGGVAGKEVIDLSVSDNEAPTENSRRHVARVERPGSASRDAGGTCKRHRDTCSRRQRDMGSQRPRPRNSGSIDLVSPEPSSTRPAESNTAKRDNSNVASSLRVSTDQRPKQALRGQDCQYPSGHSQDHAQSRNFVAIDSKFADVVNGYDADDRPHIVESREPPSSDRGHPRKKRTRDDNVTPLGLPRDRKKQKYESRPVYGSSSTHGGTRSAYHSSATKRGNLYLDLASGKWKSQSGSQSSQKISDFPNTVVDLTGDESVDTSPQPRRQLGSSPDRVLSGNNISSPFNTLLPKVTTSTQVRQGSALREGMRKRSLEQFQGRVSKDRDGRLTTHAETPGSAQLPKRRSRSPFNGTKVKDSRRVVIPSVGSSSKHRGSEIPESPPGSPAKSDAEPPRQNAPDSDVLRRPTSVANNGFASGFALTQAGNTSHRLETHVNHGSRSEGEALIRQSPDIRNEREAVLTTDGQKIRSTSATTKNSAGLTSPMSTNGTSRPVRRSGCLGASLVADKSPLPYSQPVYPPSPSDTNSEENDLSREKTPKELLNDTAQSKLSTIPKVILNNSQRSLQRATGIGDTPLASRAPMATPLDGPSIIGRREEMTDTNKARTQRQPRDTDGDPSIIGISIKVHHETEEPGSSTIQQLPTAELSNVVGPEALKGHGVSTTVADRTPSLPTQTLPSRVEKVVGHFIGEMQRDDEHWARTSLRRARLSAAIRPPLDVEEPTDIFSNMKPLTLTNLTKVPATTKKLVGTHAMFSFEVGKVVTQWAVPCTPISTAVKDVPSYSHYVSIKNNFLAQNDPTLQHWPYFGDDFDLDDAEILGAQYSLDIVGREKKLLDLGKADTCASYAEDMLEELGCAWSDVLYFLLHEDPMPDGAKSGAALQALERRHEFCGNAFRTDARWTALVARLPEPRQNNVEKAALLCDNFQKLLKFSLWHVVRKSAYTEGLLNKQHQRALDIYGITCRVCMRYDCPYHGEVKDMCDSHGNSDAASTGGSGRGHAVETDIVHPPDVNHRSRVSFPATLDTQDGPTTSKDRRTVAYWQSGSNANLKFRPDERGPFYPCHHPGTSCSNANCSCYKNQIPCEKTCACSPSCPKRFQGCNCVSEKAKSSQKLVCFESDACACFQLGRECDPDLCGECGVCDVVDPMHRDKHDGRILIGKCRNANMQRGVSKHTILGDSGVHGLGLYACETIRQHEFVGEYKGEIIQKDEAERRGAVYEHQKLSYLFSLNNTQEIDSTYFGTKTRFINHAPGSKANLYPRIIMVNAVHRIALYGQRQIAAGEELFFDYGPQFPQDQLGGKASKQQDQQSKAAPHVRNVGLVSGFEDIVHDRDELGNVRSKAASKSKRHLDRPLVWLRLRKPVLQGGADRPEGALSSDEQKISGNSIALSMSEPDDGNDEPGLNGYRRDFIDNNIRDDDLMEPRANEPDDEDFQPPSDNSIEGEEEPGESESDDDDEPVKPRGRGRPRHA